MLLQIMLRTRSLGQCQGRFRQYWRQWVLGVSVGIVGVLESECWAQSSPPYALPEVVVRGSTPLMSVPLPEKYIPVNVQVATGEDYVASGALNLTDFFARDLAGMSLSHVQNNPFQPDVLYRGFTSSFLLGTPPGLSVFIDGTRVNEPLADQVNWDLIPADAIEQVELIPGSNPVYGRNTLGGAIVMQTKRGMTNPGTLAEVWGGSFGRWRALLQTGGQQGSMDYFLSANWFTEDGFRDFSQSDVGQIFTKLGYQHGSHDLTFSLTYTNNRLTGNGPLPESRLARDRSAVYTYPDQFSPELWFLNAQYHLDFGSGFSLTSNVHGRLLDIHQFNRDVEEDVVARTGQGGWGSAVQLTYQNPILGIPVTATGGIDYLGALLRHHIAERGDGEVGEATLRNQVRKLGEGEADVFETAADIFSETHGGGIFLTLTAEPTERLTVTTAGRFDTTALQIKDRLADRGNTARTTDASGSHRFERVNPAFGATYSLLPSLGLFANYSESFRAPTAIELTCANPQAPCPIPTAIVDDPPLDAVKGKTWETGLRWSPVPQFHAALAFFRTDLEDDILFRNAQQSRVLGFFQNVKATRRQGIELLLKGTWCWGAWFLNYTLTDATFEDDIELFTFANEERIAHVQKGNLLPLVAHHRVNGGAEFSPTPYWTVRFDGSYVGAQYLRGDEANERRRLDPYFVANAQTTYQLGNIQIFFRLENMFAAEYETYGTFFDNTIDGTGIERFLGPGAPLGAFGGVRVKF